MNKLSVITALALAVVTPLQAAAKNSSSKDKLEEIIVTSSRVPMPLREIGTSVSVITEEEITQLGFNSLYDILRTQPGVAVSNAGGAGSPGSQEFAKRGLTPVRREDAAEAGQVIAEGTGQDDAAGGGNVGKFAEFELHCGLMENVNAHASIFTNGASQS